MKKLYKFEWDCGRQGSVEGMFVEDDQMVERLIGCEVYFGEILGKHSEVSGTLNRNDLKVLSEDQEKIEWLTKICGYNICGYNPINYINIECYCCGTELLEDDNLHDHKIVNNEYYCPEYNEESNFCEEVAAEDYDNDQD